jgi:tetratricopeptide (TPR) repeat protein
VGTPAPADLIKAILDTQPVRPSDMVVLTQSVEQSATAKARERNATPDKLRRMLRGDLDTIVLKALKKDPKQRYLSVNALANDLQRYLDEKTISARPEAWTYRAVKFVHRHRVPVALTAVAWLAIVAGTVSTLIQLRTARLERDFAQRQLGRTAALNEFHRFLLSDAAPTGKPLTTGELLGRAEQIVTRQRPVNDPNRVELMVSIGHQFLEQDDARNARPILEEAYRLSRGISGPSIRSGAACVLAAGLARDEEPVRAEVLFQEGLRELPEGSQYALERMDCLQEGSEVALEGNQIGQGLARAQAAQRILQQSPFDSDVLEMHAWTDLAKAYSAVGRDGEAISAFERASALLSSLGRDYTATAAVVFNEWAIELEQIGHPLEAERTYRRAIDIMSAGRAEGDISPMILNNYARCLRELGRLDEAKHYAERACANAERAAHQLAINQSLLERARIYTERHNPSRAAAMLAAVEPRLRQSLPAGHYAFAALASAQAFNALERGDRANALRLADQAVSIDEEAVKSGADGAYLLPILLTHRSEIELAAEKPEKALVDANRALDQLQKTAQSGMFSSNTGHAYLAQGRALLLTGKHDEAKVAFRSALRQFEKTLGPDRPDTVSARRQAAP